MKKILYITGSRADYGLMTSVLKEIDESEELDLNLIVTGMHLLKDFGNTQKEVAKDGYKFYIVDASYNSDDLPSTLKFMSKFIEMLTEKVQEIKPDIIMVLGDRAEMLCGAIVGQYLNVPVAHISGGDLSGHVDDPIRHSISKLSHIHFPISKKSGETLEKMGEEKKRIHIVGSTSLDNIKKMELPDKKELEKTYGTTEPYAIIIQHPVITELESIEENMKKTLDAVSESGIKSIVIHSNADAGGRKINNLVKKYDDIQSFESVNYRDFLGLLKNCSLIIGNSSSGIVEAPNFGVPCVNIGTRQRNRERACNVIDVNYDKEQITSAVKKALNDEDFKKKCSACNSPYGDGTASQKIVEVLENLDLEKELLSKGWNV